MPTFPDYAAGLTTAGSIDVDADTVVIIQGGTAKKCTPADLGGGGGGGTSYLKYVALLSQSGTDDPTAIVLENTLGGTVVWTREDVGFYVGTLAGAFVEDKTALFIVNTRGLDTGIFITRGNSNAVEIQTGDSDGTSRDSYLDVTTVEIRVYP